MAVISLDMRFKLYSEIGVVALRHSNSKTTAVPISLDDIGLQGTPEVEAFGDFLRLLVDELSASSVLLSGPQGWKAPENGLADRRKCEHEVNAPTKTGLPGVTKPASHLEFTHFCVALFDKLSESSLPRLATSGGWPTKVAIETCPAAAWRSLGIPPLPLRGETTLAELRNQTESLQDCFNLDIRGELNHGELQATVAGLAGIALEQRDMGGLAFAGVEPMEVDGKWREGYILSPTRGASF